MEKKTKLLCVNISLCHCFSEILVSLSKLDITEKNERAVSLDMMGFDFVDKDSEKEQTFGNCNKGRSQKHPKGGGVPILRPSGAGC